MNIWAIGKLMHDLTPLSDSQDFMNAQAKDDHEYHVTNGGSMLKDFYTVPFRYNYRDSGSIQRAPFSDALIDLVQQCMDADEGKRLNLQTLSFQTRKNLQAHIQRTSESDRLYYIDNRDTKQLSKQPTLNHFPFSANNEADLLAPGRNDPDDEEIQVHNERVGTHPIKDAHENAKREISMQKQRNEWSRSEKERQRAWLQDASKVRKRNGNFIFRDDEKYMPDESSEDEPDMVENTNDDGDGDDDDGDDDRWDAYIKQIGGPKKIHIISHKTRDLDLNVAPQHPPTPDLMFLEYMHRLDPTMPDEQINDEWKDLSSQQAGVFHNAYSRARRYHHRQLKLHNTRPQIPVSPVMHVDDLPSDWSDMSAQAREQHHHEWRVSKRKRDNERYRRALRAWRRTARRKHSVIEESDQFRKFWEDYCRANNLPGFQLIDLASPTMKRLDLDRLWRRQDAKRRSKLLTKYNAWLEQGMPPITSREEQREVEEGHPQAESQGQEPFRRLTGQSLDFGSDGSIPSAPFVLPDEVSRLINEQKQAIAGQQRSSHQSQLDPTQQPHPTQQPDPNQQSDSAQQPALQNVLQAPALPPVAAVTALLPPVGHQPTQTATQAFPQVPTQPPVQAQPATQAPTQTRRRRGREVDKLKIEGWSARAGKRNGRQ